MKGLKWFVCVWSLHLSALDLVAVERIVTYRRAVEVPYKFQQLSRLVNSIFGLGEFKPSQERLLIDLQHFFESLLNSFEPVESLLKDCAQSLQFIEPWEDLALQMAPIGEFFKLSYDLPPVGLLFLLRRHARKNQVYKRICATLESPSLECNWTGACAELKDVLEKVFALKPASNPF